MKQPRIKGLLERAFPGLEILDAKKPLTLFPTKVDFDHAVKKDPRHCGFANCAARICGSTQAHFFKRYVYLDRLGEDGKRRVYRYVTNRNVLETLASFDSSKPFDIKRAFSLGAPAPSQTISGMRKANKKWRQSDTAKAIAAEAEAKSRVTACNRVLEQALTLLERVKGTERPNSPAMRDANRRVESAKRALFKARENLEVKSERAGRLRRSTYATGKARPKTHEINVRTGSGWFTKSAGA